MYVSEEVNKKTCQGSVLSSLNFHKVGFADVGEPLDSRETLASYQNCMAVKIEVSLEVSSTSTRLEVAGFPSGRREFTE